MRLLTQLSAFSGLLLCIATAATGVYFGMLHHEEMRATHLNLAVGCVFVSSVAHVLSLLMLRKSK